jgi:hypothetical protein
MSKYPSRQQSPSITRRQLRPVMEAVRQYGKAHPGVLEETWYDGAPQRVVALLAGDDMATHEKILRALVSSPDFLEIRHSEWPQGHLERLRLEITDFAQDSISSMELGKGVLGVNLRGGQVEVAASLHERYGDAVVITVGAFPYPRIESGDASIFDSNRELPDWAPLPDEVSVSLEKGIEIRSGSHVRSTLTIRNETMLEVVTDQRIAPIVDPTSGLVVGRYNGVLTMEWRRDRIPAGESKEVPILIGTASTQRDLGYSVPPGSWAIRVYLHLGHRRFQRDIPIAVLP